MIRYIDRYARTAGKPLLEDYFRLRKHVFCDQLGWVTPPGGDLEIDEFDKLDNVYVLDVDEKSGRLVGGARLMPTTGPTLLHSQWSNLLPAAQQYKSDDLWEVTRFCVDDRAETRKNNFVNRATVELAFGVMRFAAEKKIPRLIAICELNFFGMAGAFGEDPEIIATHIDTRGNAYGCGIWHVEPNFLSWATKMLQAR